MKDPHAIHSTSARKMLVSLWTNRGLIARLVNRDIAARYKGAAVGLAWSFITPLLMLSVYTFVFSVVFQARWNEEVPAGKASFALVMFIGMLVHGLFAEVINRSPALLLANPNFVKKVVFPIEILPVVSTGSAIFHTLVSTLIFLVALLVLTGELQWTALFFPLIIFPLVVFTLGVAWFLCSLGVYLRDVSQLTVIFTTVLLFLAPVFYPLTALPEDFRWAIRINPLTFIIEQSRDVLMWGKMPDFKGLAAYSLVAFVTAWLGFAWFQKTRKGFADVI